MKSIYNKRAVEMMRRFVDCAKVDDIDGAAKSIGEIQKAGFDQGYIVGLVVTGLGALTSAAIIHFTNKRKYINS